MLCAKWKTDDGIACMHVLREYISQPYKHTWTNLSGLIAAFLVGQLFHTRNCKHQSGGPSLMHFTRWCMYSLCSEASLHILSHWCDMCILFWCVHCAMLMLVINKKWHHLFPACANSLSRIPVYYSTEVMDSYSIINLRISMCWPAAGKTFSHHKQYIYTLCTCKI